MPPRKDAEAAIEAEMASPATGNVDVESLLHDLDATQTLVLNQEALIQRLSEKVDELERRAEPGEPAPKQTYEPPPLAEGTKRYSSRFSEQTLMRVAHVTRLVEGIPVEVPVQGPPVDFEGGVYETSDPDVQEWLENHPEYGISFWEDPTAVRRHGQVDVQTGVRASEMTPRAPLVAPMQP